MLEDDSENKYYLRKLSKYLSILEAMEKENYRHLLNQDNWETSYLF